MKKKKNDKVSAVCGMIVETIHETHPFHGQRNRMSVYWFNGTTTENLPLIEGAKPNDTVIISVYKP